MGSRSGTEVAARRRLGPKKIARKQVIQVPIEPDLLARIDDTVGRVAESRAAFIREACRLRLRMLAAGELDRQYVEGYRRKPEDGAWSGTAVRMLPRVWPPEKW